jgi:hypothetical protein
MPDNANRLPPDFDIDPRQRQAFERIRRRTRLAQAGVCFWVFASTFVIVPLIFRHHPLWFIAIATGIIGGIAGYFLPVNVPMPRQPPRDADSPYGIYDPNGPHGPRS